MISSIKNISLYIPHVFINFNKEYIANAFKSFGEIDHIDLIGKLGRNGKEYNAVYIHFKMWYDTEYNRSLQSDLIQSYETRVYHDRPWYWIILLNNAKKNIPGGSKSRDLGESYVNGATNTSENLNTEQPTQKKSLKNDPLKDESKISAQLKDEIDALIIDAQIDAEIDAEIEAEIEKMEAQFDEVEALMEEDDANLVYIDGRYIQVIEEENMWLRNEVLQLNQALINLDHMYKVESAKARAFNLPAFNNIEENL
jgi:hypothetical protein